ncbi:hypothetical protein L484_007583 [Morus notabilis]|uniref:Uncharacterized protein n=1 Tax=Morus notabilis TaxID=981085 RepID=W9QX36_9ROSA|nr:hypothetical protein L484_007583 [Morus notabilis]
MELRKRYGSFKRRCRSSIRICSHFELIAVDRITMETGQPMRSTGLQANRSTGPVDWCAHYRSTGNVVLLCHRSTGAHGFDPVWPEKCYFDPVLGENPN